MDKLLSFCDSDLLYSSRIHKLQSFSQPTRKVFLKREDESSFGISGYKKRKYASLIPYLLQHNFERAILIGGLHANHISGCLQLLNEKKIRPFLLLKESHQKELVGNGFLTQLLWQNEQMKWVPVDQWPTVEQIGLEQVKGFDEKTFLIPEGGACKEALPGACTLYLDILRNEGTLAQKFDHIFIDAGTGFSAGALTFMRDMYQGTSTIHVVLMAGTMNTFTKNTARIFKWGNECLQHQLPLPQKLSMYFPATAKSFGSVNSSVIEFIKGFARAEGVLTDPIYSGKLMLTAKHIIEEKNLQGNILIIHSGGGTGLLGFSSKFEGKL